MNRSPAPMLSTTSTAGARQLPTSPRRLRAMQPLEPRLTTLTCNYLFSWRVTCDHNNCEGGHVGRDSFHLARLQQMSLDIVEGVLLCICGYANNLQVAKMA